MSGDSGNLPAPLRHILTPSQAKAQATHLLSIYHVPNTVLGSLGEFKDRPLFLSKNLQLINQPNKQKQNKTRNQAREIRCRREKEPLCYMSTASGPQEALESRAWAMAMPGVCQDRLCSKREALKSDSPRPSPGKSQTSPPSWEAWEGFGELVWAGGSAETPSGWDGVDARQLRLTRFRLWGLGTP